MADSITYKTIWRWHLYAGLFVLPFVLILSVSGAIYLFKPQIDKWEETDFLQLADENPISADKQLAVALGAYPGSEFNHYRLPRSRRDAAMFQLRQADGSRIEAFISPQGKVIGVLDPDARLSAKIAKFHGSLLLGKWGDTLVELAASWTIVMILTGLYLWWPRPFTAAGTLWPRVSLRGRALLKDIHRVTGFWIAGLVLIMLASGLPWAGTWGAAFQWVRAEFNLVAGPQGWKVGSEDRSVTSLPATQHLHHDGAKKFGDITPAAGSHTLALSTLVAKAEAENMPFPTLILPPNSPQQFGPPTGNFWTIKSEAQNRPKNRTVTFDVDTGEELDRTGFEDKHVVDRVVSYGIAWHEGQLFGLMNQIIGLLTAVALIVVSVLGFVMWLRRRPRGGLGTPRTADVLNKPVVLVVSLTLLVLLPLFAISILALAVVEWLLIVANQMRSDGKNEMKS